MSDLFYLLKELHYLDLLKDDLSVMALSCEDIFDFLKQDVQKNRLNNTSLSKVLPLLRKKDEILKFDSVALDTSALEFSLFLSEFNLRGKKVFTSLSEDCFSSYRELTFKIFEYLNKLQLKVLCFDDLKGFLSCAKEKAYAELSIYFEDLNCALLLNILKSKIFYVNTVNSLSLNSYLVFLALEFFVSCNLKDFCKQKVYERLIYARKEDHLSINLYNQRLNKIKEEFNLENFDDFEEFLLSVEYENFYTLSEKDRLLVYELRLCFNLCKCFKDEDEFKYFYKKANLVNFYV